MRDRDCERRSVGQSWPDFIEKDLKHRSYLNQEHGEDIPGGWDERPRLRPDLQEVWALFQKLSKGRPVLVVMQPTQAGLVTVTSERPIEQTEIQSGILNAGVRSREVHAMWAWLLGEMDDIWLAREDDE